MPTPIILIIEDDPRIADTYARLLEAESLSTVVAADGKAGLALAKREIPDLIVLDIMLPKMNGLAVLKALKQDEVTNRIPVIMSSQSSDQQTIDQALAGGAERYFVKNQTSPTQVITAAKELLI